MVTTRAGSGDPTGSRFFAAVLPNRACEQFGLALDGTKSRDGLQEWCNNLVFTCCVDQTPPPLCGQRVEDDPLPLKAFYPNAVPCQGLRRVSDSTTPDGFDSGRLVPTASRTRIGRLLKINSRR